MTPGKFRLAVAVVLFLGWIGWLAYLAFVKPPPVVVSRSQLMVAGLAGVARIELDPEGRPETALVEQVLGPGAAQGPAVGATLHPFGHGSVRLPGGKTTFQPGTLYLIPLTKAGDNQFRVVASPRSPGYDVQSPPVIYPWNPEVERQVKELLR